MSGLTPERHSLLEQARWAARNAYAPSSGFRVGAVIVSAGGRMFTGANVENASYGLSICAERVALFKAVSEGERDFTELAVVAEADGGEADAPPCGACRQALSEFSPALKVTYRSQGGYVTRPLTELLPDAFDKKDNRD
ncbi:MAG: cytidine deaminase [Actinobacteria bacterium]|nr:cytidine deaminase [Actinomycetota bacterium]